MWLTSIVFVVAGLVTWISLDAVRSLHSSRLGSTVVAFLYQLRITQRNAVELAIPPVVEEVFFRGLLSHVVEPATSMVLFACLHRGPWLRSAAFLFAFVMEALMANSGMLISCIAAHMAVNLTTFAFVQRIPLLKLPDGTHAIAL